MESPQNIIKSLEVKIKALEIENQKLALTIDLNNKEIKEYKSLIQSLSTNNTANSEVNNEINLKFRWKASDTRRKLLCEIKNDSKTIKKISGNGSENCTVIGDVCLIKGKINKWKIQVDKINNDPPHILFGIVPENVDLNGIHNYKTGYATNFSNFDKHNLGVWSENYRHGGKKGDIIEIIVDLEKGQLSFILNDIDLGIFCDNIDKNINYVPFVEMIHVGTEISLL